MRFPQISGFVSGAAVVLATALLVGCEGLTPKSFDPNKGFLDPSEVAVTRNGKQPLMVPILDKIDPATEEDADQFAEATEVRPYDLVPTAGDYKLGKSDLVSVSITDLVGPGIETVKTVRVSESGRISLPLVGQIDAVGLTEAQLETLVAQKYRDANIIQNAQVAVVVYEARARTFSIIGSVAQAGQYAILKNDFRLLDALVLARDLTVDTDVRGNRGIEWVYVIRETKEDDDVQQIQQDPQPGVPAPPPTNPDVLAPRSDAAQNAKRENFMMMQDMGAAAQPVEPPADQPAADPPAADQPAVEVPATEPAAPPTGEGRYIIVDGKPVLVTGEEPTTAPDAMVPPVELTPADPAAGTATTQGFAFNELAPVTNKRIIKIPVARLKEGDLRYNIVIRPDDLIVVRPPQQGEYYMGGHVARVGVYSLTARKITLTQAVISAGMLDALAIPGRTEIRRRIGGDKEIICRVDLEKIFAGQHPNIYLKAEDQIIVGTNAVAPFLASLRGGFRMTYGFGFLYDRNYGPRDRN